MALLRLRPRWTLEASSCPRCHLSHLLERTACQQIGCRPLPRGHCPQTSKAPKKAHRTLVNSHCPRTSKASQGKAHQALVNSCCPRTSQISKKEAHQALVIRPLPWGGRSLQHQRAPQRPFCQRAAQSQQTQSRPQPVKTLKLRLQPSGGAATSCVARLGKSHGTPGVSGVLVVLAVLTPWWMSPGLSPVLWGSQQRALSPHTSLGS